MTKTIILGHDEDFIPTCPQDVMDAFDRAAKHVVHQAVEWIRCNNLGHLETKPGFHRIRAKLPIAVDDDVYEKYILEKERNWNKDV